MNNYIKNTLIRAKRGQSLHHIPLCQISAQMKLQSSTRESTANSSHVNDFAPSKIILFID